MILSRPLSTMISLMKTLLLISVFSAVGGAVKNTERNQHKCSVSESNLSPREYFHSYVSNRVDRHQHVLNKYSKVMNNHHQQTIFDKVLNGSSSKHEWKQWQSMYRTVLLAGLSMDDLPDTLCVFATVLNETVEIENGDDNDDVFNCAFEESMYCQRDLSYRIINKILTEKGCSILSIPEAILPKCHDPSKCVDGGVNFMYGEIWQEFNGTMDFLSEDADQTEAREMYTLLKPVYDAGDLYGKYVVAVTTLIAMELDWLIKTKQHESPGWLAFINAISMFEELIESPPNCECQDLEKTLLKVVEMFIAKGWEVISEVKKHHASLCSQGHVVKLKDKHSKKACKH